MRLFPYILCMALIASCGEGEFVGANGRSADKEDKPATPEEQRTPTDAEAPANPNDPAQDNTGTDDSSSDATTGTTTSGETGDTSGDLLQCALSNGGEPDDVITVTGGDPDLDLKPDSIVLVEVRGNADISIESAEIERIKGICVRATGGASINLDLSFTVGQVDYYGRGSVESVITFGKDGTLEKLVTDISGGHSLKIEGESVDCSAIALDQSGSSKVYCRGNAL